MAEPRRLAAGDIAFLYEPGLIRRLEVAGTEVVRMISVPVRDANWGTFPPTLLSSDVRESPEAVRIKERFSVADGGLLADLVFEVRSDGNLSADLTFTGHDDVQTNRAGFTLLHPIARTIGTELIVTHSDGRAVPTRFPECIAPGQPAIDIVDLAHRVDGLGVTITFEGETFEIEDQRNWSDASFKTYCRPLSLPFPYTIKKGETVSQSIAISLNREDTGIAAKSTPLPTKTVRLPKLCLALEPDWLHGSLPTAMVPVLRFAVHDAWSGEALAQVAATHREVDVETVVPDGDEADAVCALVRERLDQAGLRAAHVTVLPEAYLKSYQPSGPWPEGISLEDCAQAARNAFPKASIGAGMLTHFTEFNRRPPTTALGDFITFSNTAIVHAADDLSVWETLETLPHIFQSAQVLSGGLPMRLGLVSIGMRSNPYGAAMAANPDRSKITMTGEDPRQTEPFAAAYAVAAFALAAQAGVEAITLAAPVGRLGMASDDGLLHPLGEVLMALTKLGPEAAVSVEGARFSLLAAGRIVAAEASGVGSVQLDGFGEHDG